MSFVKYLNIKKARISAESDLANEHTSMFSIFTKGNNISATFTKRNNFCDNFCDFLFASLDKGAFPS